MESGAAALPKNPVAAVHDRRICKSVEPEENHKKGLRWSSARNQMGNIKSNNSLLGSRPPIRHHRCQLTGKT